MKKLIIKKLEKFIEINRKICWESAYENGEYCIGENSIREFINRLLNEEPLKKI